MGDWQQYALLAGLILITYFMLRMGWRRRQGRGASMEPSYRRERRTRPTSPNKASVPDQALNEVLMQMQEVSREIEARLDTKIRFARRIVEESSQVLQELQTETARARELAERTRGGAAPPGATSRTDVAANEPRANPARGSSPDCPAQEEPSRKPRARREPRPQPSAPAEQAQSPPPSADRAPDSRAISDQETVERLTAAGRTPAEIAETIGRPVGEVELIQALGRQAREPRATG